MASVLWRCESSPAHHLHAEIASRPRCPLVGASIPHEICDFAGTPLPVEQDLASSILVGGAKYEAAPGSSNPVGRVALNHAMEVQLLPLVPNTRPGQVGRRRSAAPPRLGSIPRVGSNCWSSSEGKSGTLKPCGPAARNRPPAPLPSSSAARAAGLHPEERRFESVPREPNTLVAESVRQPAVTRRHRGSSPREGAIRGWSSQVQDARLGPARSEVRILLP